MAAIVDSITNVVSGNLAVSVLAAFLFYNLGLVFYRLFLSPLAKFPGPKIAAATGYYEFYHDYFRHGQYVFEIKKMHDKYGPIVRINPDELSVHDPDFYNELYVAGSVRRTENYDHFARGIEFDGSHFLSTDHDLHRRRRKPLEPFFSRLGVTRLEPMVAGVANRLVKRFEAVKGTGQVMRLDHAFVALSGDVIGRICCDNHTDMVDEEDFGVDWYNLLHDFIHRIPLVMAFPQMVSALRLIPERIMLWLDPRMKQMEKFQNMARQHIIDAKSEKQKLSDSSFQSKNNTIFRHILTSGLPESDLSVDRLGREAQVLLGAGTVSSARTMDFIAFYIMNDDKVRARLQEELAPLMKDYPHKMPSWADLEKLSYFQALLKEGLRLSYGVMHRLPRVSPDVAIRFKDWVIPKGVPVGMSAYMMHTDERVYDEPFKFKPERWLDNVTPAMNRSLVPFAKGSRNCLGMNLAYVELNLVLASLFRPGGPELRLHETDESDIVQSHDYLIPLPKLTSKGLRIKVY
ncbi:cytochrome P450 [Massariosphaeria phaeospora]|uniref:Cytochrome P450 n=1 Tax=Massariosphaeria phaeospora TaxID=100035 RepID=A0A7C8I761_9PLEO|nr:cytochrome P450 [Massariosphaeria phaeospora]